MRFKDKSCSSKGFFQVFGEYLDNLEKRMKGQKRRILLLTDNAPSHRVRGAVKEEIDGFEVYRLQHVTVLFLPANTTSVIQPLDAGIIAAFKAQYRRCFLRWHLAELGAAEAGTDLSKIQPNVKQASRSQ